MRHENKTQFERYEAFREAIAGLKQVFEPQDVLEALQDEWEAFVVTLGKDDLPAGLLTGLEMIGRDDLIAAMSDGKDIIAN